MEIERFELARYVGDEVRGFVTTSRPVVFHRYPHGAWPFSKYPPPGSKFWSAKSHNIPISGSITASVNAAIEALPAGVVIIVQSLIFGCVDGVMSVSLRYATVEP